LEDEVIVCAVWWSELYISERSETHPTLEDIVDKSGRRHGHTYKGFFPKILINACSTFANSSCSCSYDKVVISVCDQVWDAIVCPLIISLPPTRVVEREKKEFLNERKEEKEEKEMT